MDGSGDLWGQKLGTETGTDQHWSLEGPLPGQDLPFELERAQEFECIGSNREMGDITEDDWK